MQAVVANISLQPRNRITGELVGQYHLQKLPVVPIKPQGLILGSYESLVRVKLGVMTKFGANSPTHKKWESWSAENAPKSDSVIDFLRTHPADYPESFRSLFSLRKPIYSSLPADIPAVTSMKRKRKQTSEDLRVIVATASMKTSTQPGYESTTHYTTTSFLA